MVRTLHSEKMAHGLLVLLLGIGLGTALYFFLTREDEHGSGRQRQSSTKSSPNRSEGVKHVECPICLEHPMNYGGVQVIPCMHTFHKVCIEEWRVKGTRAHLTCPVCREEITGLEQL